MIMARGKRAWTIRLWEHLSQSVSWGCQDTGGKDSDGNDTWARFVRINTRMADDRDVTLSLTPNEALAFAAAIVRQAGRVSAMNIEQGNGGVYPNEFGRAQR